MPTKIGTTIPAEVVLAHDLQVLVAQYGRIPRGSYRTPVTTLAKSQRTSRRNVKKAGRRKK